MPLPLCSVSRKPRGSLKAPRFFKQIATSPRARRTKSLWLPLIGCNDQPGPIYFIGFPGFRDRLLSLSLSLSLSYRAVNPDELGRIDRSIGRFRQRINTARRQPVAIHHCCHYRLSAGSHVRMIDDDFVLFVYVRHVGANRVIIRRREYQRMKTEKRSERDEFSHGRIETGAGKGNRFASEEPLFRETLYFGIELAESVNLSNSINFLINSLQI